jgi:hypothetical protein
MHILEKVGITFLWHILEKVGITFLWHILEKVGACRKLLGQHFHITG